jgi:methionyl-tRNA formyltransferase
MRIAFAGTPDFSVPALEALLGSTHEVVGVLTQPDRPKGRGRQIAASPVKETALAHGVPVSQPQSLKDEAGRADLASWQPDVLVVVAYGLILPRAALTLPRLGCLNIHASLLPRWRGAAPIQRAILAGDAKSGVTIMLMDAGLDTGPMLLKKEVLIARTDTGGSLHDRLAVVGASAILEALEGYSSGNLPAVPQPTEGVTYAAKIEKAEALIDWAQDAIEIERKVRAFNPWPVAESRLDGEQLRVFEAFAEHDAADSAGAPQPGPSSALVGGRAGTHAVGPALVPTPMPGAVATPGVVPAPAPTLPPGGAATPGVVPAAPFPIPGRAQSVADPVQSWSLGPHLDAFGADPDRSSPVPGTIVAVRNDAIVVKCGNGSLALRQVQRPGRRAVAAGDFIRGTQLLGKRLG